MRRVLSLWQPWASLCVSDDPHWMDRRPAKAWETRHWQPRQPLPIDIVIHATRRHVRPPYPTAFARIVDRCIYRPMTRPMAFGSIIAIATITKVVPTEQLLTRWNGVYDDEIACGDYSAGRYGWQLSNVVALPHPIAFKGRQEALYLLDDATEARINEQLGSVPA